MPEVLDVFRRNSWILYPLHFAVVREGEQGEVGPKIVFRSSPGHFLGVGSDTAQQSRRQKPGYRQADFLDIIVNQCRVGSESFSDIDIRHGMLKPASGMMIDNDPGPDIVRPADHSPAWLMIHQCQPIIGRPFDIAEVVRIQMTLPDQRMIFSPPDYTAVGHRCRIVTVPSGKVF